MLELLCGSYQRPFGWKRRMRPKVDIDIENMEVKVDNIIWRK